MNIYNAIMEAADHIERHPQLFDYNKILVPDCGTPGCALGWIGALSETKAVNEILPGYPVNVGQVAKQLLKIDAADFYSRMSGCDLSQTGWCLSAHACAKALRVYADRYHGDERKDDAFPAWLATLKAKIEQPIAAGASLEYVS